MTRFQKEKLKDMVVIATVCILVGGGIFGLTWLFLDSNTGYGPECLIIRCVKVIN